MKPCLLIPIYNHHGTIIDVVRSLASLNLSCLIIDDGSDAQTQQALGRASREFPWVVVERLPVNRGRGAALTRGYELAMQRGFSHVVQLDADGQHEAADVPRFLEAARSQPTALILGEPIFDETAPRSRRYGRKLSCFLVHIETLSTSIRDPLCGFRCVPVESALALIRRATLGRRMEFDPELAVRLVWEGLSVVNVATRVRYFSGGVSHFRLVRDNLRITGMHTQLVFGMVARLPELLRRKWRRSR